MEVNQNNQYCYLELTNDQYPPNFPSKIHLSENDPISSVSFSELALRALHANCSHYCLAIVELPNHVYKVYDSVGWRILDRYTKGNGGTLQDPLTRLLVKKVHYFAIALTTQGPSLTATKYPPSQYLENRTATEKKKIERYAFDAINYHVSPEDPQLSLIRDNLKRYLSLQVKIRNRANLGEKEFSNRTTGIEYTYEIDPLEIIVNGQRAKRKESPNQDPNIYDNPKKTKR